MSEKESMLDMANCNELCYYHCIQREGLLERIALLGDIWSIGNMIDAVLLLKDDNPVVEISVRTRDKDGNMTEFTTNGIGQRTIRKLN